MLWGTREPAIFIMGTWKHEQIFQGKLGSKWILGSNLVILLDIQKHFWDIQKHFWDNQKTFLRMRVIFETFLWNMETQTSPGT